MDLEEAHYTSIGYPPEPGQGNFGGVDMAEDTIHTRTLQVTVRFTDEQRDAYLSAILSVEDVSPEGKQTYMSEAVRSEIIDHLESVGLDATVTIVERMAVG